MIPMKNGRIWASKVNACFFFLKKKKIEVNCYGESTSRALI